MPADMPSKEIIDDLKYNIHVAECFYEKLKDRENHTPFLTKSGKKPMRINKFINSKKSATSKVRWKLLRQISARCSVFPARDFSIIQNSVREIPNVLNAAKILRQTIKKQLKLHQYVITEAKTTQQILLAAHKTQ
ncbi:hypothetical protein NPIL_15971 [Nephila pilipes]|uniref:Uncharacterized protein n=1 Tax=Nephila pilipes TaxID=299642 RepID=A0A8X6UQB4_NEPPI|nr:hypothetical protein NPIL_15971 [Nephila pilipes]